MAKKGRIGGTLEDFLKEEGILEEANKIAIKRVLAFKIQEEMEKNNLSKTAMAKRMKTSRSALDRLLDPANTSITLNTMEQAAHVLGKKITLSLEPA